MLYITEIENANDVVLGVISEIMEMSRYDVSCIEEMTRGEYRGFVCSNNGAYDVVVNEDRGEINMIFCQGAIDWRGRYITDACHPIGRIVLLPGGNTRFITASPFRWRWRRSTTDEVRQTSYVTYLFGEVIRRMEALGTRCNIVASS